MFKNEGDTRIQRISTPKTEQFDDGPYAALMDMVPEAGKKQLIKYRDGILRGDEMERPHEYLVLAAADMARDMRVLDKSAQNKLSNWYKKRLTQFSTAVVGGVRPEDVLLSLFAVNQLIFGKAMLTLSDRVREIVDHDLQGFEERGRDADYAVTAIARKLADPTWDGFSQKVLDSTRSGFRRRFAEGMINPSSLCALKLFKPDAFPKDLTNDEWREYARRYIAMNHVVSAAGMQVFASIMTASAERAWIDERGLHITPGKKRGMVAEVREKPISRSI